MLKSPAMMSASFFLRLSWVGTGALLKLRALVLLRCADTDVYVRFPSLGGLLNFDLTVRHFRPNESCLDVPGITSSVFTPPGSNVFLWNRMS